LLPHTCGATLGGRPRDRQLPSASRRACAQRVPRNASSAWTRGTPYAPLRSWIRRMSSDRRASTRARSEGGREVQAQKPLGETPSTRHIVVTGKVILSRSTNRYTITGSRRSLWRRRPRPCSGSPARSAGCGSPVAAASARPARRCSGRDSRRDQCRPG